MSGHANQRLIRHQREAERLKKVLFFTPTLIGGACFPMSRVASVLSTLRDYPVTPEGNTLTRDHDEPSGLVGGVEVEKEEGGSKEAEQMPGQLKGPWECDECGQSVKPPLESQYYF